MASIDASDNPNKVSYSFSVKIIMSKGEPSYAQIW